MFTIVHMEEFIFLQKKCRFTKEVLVYTYIDACKM